MLWKGTIPATIADIFNIHPPSPETNTLKEQRK
jgi:hypothetical protein